MIIYITEIVLQVALTTHKLTNNFQGRVGEGSVNMFKKNFFEKRCKV